MGMEGKATVGPWVGLTCFEERWVGVVVGVGGFVGEEVRVEREGNAGVVGGS